MKKYIIDGMEFDADIVMKMFEEVFDYVGTFLLKKSDREMEGIIYEDYDFHYTNLADFRLDILCDSNYITNEIKEKAHKMRLLSEKMLSEGVERSSTVIRNTSEWNQIFSIADEIKLFLAHKCN